MATTAKTPYATSYSFKDIGYLGVTAPNGTGTPLTDSDIGKPVAWGTAGFEVATSGVIEGFMVDTSPDGNVTIQVGGFVLCTMATSACAAGDYVIAAAGGTVAPNGTTGATTASTAIAFYVVDTTHVWVRMLG